MSESPTRPNSIQPFPLAPWFSQNHLLRPSNQREPSGARLPAAIALSRYQNGERTERSSAPQHNPSIPFALAPSLSQIHLSLQPKATRADARAPGFQLPSPCPTVRMEGQTEHSSASRFNPTSRLSPVVRPKSPPAAFNHTRHTPRQHELTLGHQASNYPLSVPLSD